jgi:hypothetical protein
MNKNYARESRFNPQTRVSFFNELEIEMRTMLVGSISFFNEVSRDTKKTILVDGFIF